MTRSHGKPAAQSTASCSNSENFHRLGMNDANFQTLSEAAPFPRPLQGQSVESKRSMPASLRRLREGEEQAQRREANVRIHGLHEEQEGRNHQIP